MTQILGVLTSLVGHWLPLRSVSLTVMAMLELTIAILGFAGSSTQRCLR
jgi:hypothetical protein